MSDVYAAADTYRQELLDLDRRAAKRMADAYRRVYSELQRRMKYATDELERLRADPEATPLDIEKALFKSDRWRQAYNGARDELARFNAVARGITQDAQGEAINLGVDHMDGLIKVAAGDGPVGMDYSFAKPDTQALAAMMGFASNGSPLASLFESIGPEALGLARGVLGQGVALGWSPVVIGKQLAGPLGLPAWRGLTIARTETLRAYREAQRQTVLANDDVLEGWIWHSARDRRTCEVCWSMDGKLFPIVAGLSDTAGHQSMVVGEVKATDYLEGHVNCRCTLIPRPKSYADILGDPSIPDARDPITTGPGEFAKLPATIQQRILGPGKYELFKQGVPLEAFVDRHVSSDWGASRVAKPLSKLTDELRAGGWSGGTTAGYDASRHLPSGPRLLEFVDGETADIELKRLYGKWRDGLSDAERESIGFYSSSGYRHWNAALRGQVAIESDWNKYIKHIDDALARSAAPSDMVVWRAIRANALPAAPDQKVGRMWSDPAFVSTSAAKAEAQKFAWFATEDGGEPVLLRVRVPRGTHGGYLEDASRVNLDEYELLLPRGVKFKVVGTHRETLPQRWDNVPARDIAVLDVEVLP